MGRLVGGGRGKLQQVAKPPNLWISIFAFQKPVDLNIRVSKTLDLKKKYSDIETFYQLTLYSSTECHSFMNVAVQ